MNLFLKYSLLTVIIFISYVFPAVCGNTTNNDYSNIEYQPLPGINIPANISEKIESNNISYKKDTINDYPNFNPATKLNVVDDPSVTFTFDPANAVCSGTTIEFTPEVKGTGTSELKYLWEFESGKTSNLEKPSYIFN